MTTHWLDVEIRYSLDKQNPCPASGPRWEVWGSLKSAGFIFWEPWMSLQDLNGNSSSSWTRFHLDQLLVGGPTVWLKIDSKWLFKCLAKHMQRSNCVTWRTKTISFSEPERLYHSNDKQISGVCRQWLQHSYWPDKHNMQMRPEEAANPWTGV